MSFWITKKVINTDVTNVLIELFNIKVLKKAWGLSVGFIDNRNDHMTPGVWGFFVRFVVFFLY